MRSSARAAADRIDRRIRAAAPRLLTGIVADIDTSGRIATVVVDLGTLSAPISPDATVTIGETVTVLRAGASLLVLGPAGTPAFLPAPALQTPAGGVQQFPALDSGTLSSSNTWADSTGLNADSTDQGFWFHGRTLLDSLPGVLPATSAPLQIWVDPQTPGPMTFFLHGYATRAAAAYVSARTPRSTITVAGPGWVTLPNAWATTLLSSGGSIGIDTSGSVKGLAEDGQSGAIRIAWTR